MKKDAVTFIELLVAMSIFSVIAVAIYSSFNAGLFTWRRLTESADISGKAVIILKLMSDDIASYIPSEKVKLEGDESSISFLSVSGKRGSAALNKANYSYDRQSGNITRTRQDFKSVLNDEPAENLAVENLCSKVKALGFKYLYKKEGAESEYEWFDSTNPDAKTPCVAINIHLEMANGAKFDRTAPLYVLPEEKKS